MFYDSLINLAAATAPISGAGAGAVSGAHRTEAILIAVLLQLTIIIITARIVAWLLRRLGQPTVIGEIAAGLLLGPSAFKALFPNKWAFVFGDPSAGMILNILSHLGLVFLLFMVGLEFDFTHLKTRGRMSVLVSLAGVALPFVLGFGLAWLIRPLVAPHLNPWGFYLFMGTAMSITAMPVLARILMELNIAQTSIGTVTISAAAINDAIGWILLAAVSAIATANYHPTQSLWMIGLTAAFFLFMLFVARLVLVRGVRWALARGGGELGPNTQAMLFVILFLCAIVTSEIGIFAIFGAFILGAVLSGEGAFKQAVAGRHRQFINVFFLPIFFTYTGLRTNIGLLNDGKLWLIALAVLAVAIIGKFAGCALAARVCGSTWREAGCIGALMNTRGLMELIVINVGKDLGVIPDSVFSMLVLMALVTTVMTTPLILLFSPGTELAGWIEKSEFKKT